MICRNSSATKKKKLTICSGWPANFFRKHRVLRRNADGAGIEMAFPHHDAAFDDQRRGRKPEFFRAQQRGDGDITPGLHLPVGLDPDAAAQIVEHKRLMCFRQAQFPGNAGILDEESGEAPVPPESPLISTLSAWAFATPAATVPTPTSDTSLTETAASDWSFSNRRSAARDLRSNRCRGAAAAKSAARPAWHTEAAQCSRSTLWPGNCPPSPGLAPCAILICNSLALTR